MRDEKKERKEQARSNKQTKQSNTAHPRQSLFLRKMSCTCTSIIGSSFVQDSSSVSFSSTVCFGYPCSLYSCYLIISFPNIYVSPPFLSPLPQAQSSTSECTRLNVVWSMPSSTASVSTYQLTGWASLIAFWCSPRPSTTSTSMRGI